MTSLEGLNSLIQLESTRLEGAKQTTQNFQSVGSMVQQQGTQTAQSRMNMTMNRIEGQYSKECAMADVRKLERKLARERAAESLAKNIACIATISNAVGNLGHMFNDLNGRQKLGDTPDYLKSPPLDPSKAKVSITQQAGDTHASTVYLSGETNKDGSETVYSYDIGQNGVSVSKLPLAATITEYDKERIGGEEYAKMKAENGGNPLSFAEIHQKNPQLADRLVEVRGHGVSSSEAENLMSVASTAIKDDGSAISRPTSSQAQSEGAMNAARLAAISVITNKDSETINAEQIAQIAGVIGDIKLTSTQNEAIFGTKSPTSDEIKTKLGDPEVRKKLFADKNFMAKLESKYQPTLSSAVDKMKANGKDAKLTQEEITQIDSKLTFEDKERIFGKGNGDKKLEDLLGNPLKPENVKKLVDDTKVQENLGNIIRPQNTEYLSKKNDKGNEDVQYRQGGLNFQVSDISADDKEKILGKDFRNKSFSEIQAIQPNGQELAKKLLAGTLERDFREMSGDKKLAFLKNYPEIALTKPSPENFNKLSKDDRDKLKADYGFDGTNFDTLDKDKQDKIKEAHPELFFNAQGLANLISSNPSKANEAIKELGSVPNSNVRVLTPAEAQGNVDRVGLMKNVGTSKSSLRDYLSQNGKIDTKSDWEHVKDVGKAGVNFLVKTIEQSAPYFQAYLKAKEKADQTYEELQAAIDKLNAASKKLRAMEMQIDAFSGRGS